MKKIYAVVLILFCLFYSAETVARNPEKLSKQFQDTLTLIIEKAETVIDPEWFIVRNDTGFTLYYCKTCREAYLDYSENRFERKYDTTFAPAEWYNGFLFRSDFFDFHGPDSIHFHNMVNPVRSDYTTSKKPRFPFNGILQLNIYFEPAWSTEKLSEIRSINDTMTNCILANEGRINEFTFADYRYYVYPYLKNQCSFKGYHLQQRMPYNSSLFNYAIFIVNEDRLYGSRAYFLDEGKDSLIEKNQLDPLVDRTLRISALVLGVHDFKTTEDYLQEYREKNSKNRKRSEQLFFQLKENR